MIFIDYSTIAEEIELELTRIQKNKRKRTLQLMRKRFNSSVQPVKIRVSTEHYRYAPIEKYLLETHQSKCAYCECSIYIDRNNPEKSNKSIEHYRPKNSYRHKYGSIECHPGYYWLAYNISNLLMSCKDCNNAKDNYFPLMLSSNRCSSHHGNLTKEEPLIINPTRDNPQNHIYFDKTIIKSKTYIGRISIKYLKLNRIDLLDKRKDVYDSLSLLKKFSDRSQRGMTNYRVRLTEAAEGKAQYSKMILDNFN